MKETYLNAVEGVVLMEALEETKVGGKGGLPERV